MKIIHSIQNTDVLAAPSLSKAFSEKSLNKSLNIFDMQFSIADIWRNGKTKVYRINGRVTLDSKEEDTISKVAIFFPESKYSLEKIFETKEYELDFVHQNDAERDYFNIVIFDKDNYVISSSTYVFDVNRVFEHPIQKKDMSDLQVRNRLKEQQDSIMLETELEDGQTTSVNHIWQNVGQHYMIENPTKKNSNTYVSSLSKRSMCSGVWMVIVTDQHNKLITQYIINV